MTPLEEISIVIPTIGRPSVVPLLRGLARGGGRPAQIVLVDDRPNGGDPLPVPSEVADVTKVVTGAGAGPAAARNTGWRAARGAWIAFLDDDVVPAPDWLERLAADLRVGGTVGAVQGRVHVPLPAHRRPTDWERQTGNLAGGRWITADMAYRRSALAAVGGFDERFTRAYREDSEMAYRVVEAGWTLVVGQRRVSHPVRPQGTWLRSVQAQRGNADDALLRRLYGPGWRRLIDVPGGRRPAHVVTSVTAAAAVVSGLLAAGDRAARVTRPVAVATGLAWLAATGEFALARIRPGPRDPREWVTMVVSSALIPPLATAHWLAGWWRSRGAGQWSG